MISLKYRKFLVFNKLKRVFKLAAVVLAIVLAFYILSYYHMNDKVSSNGGEENLNEIISNIQSKQAILMDKGASSLTKTLNDLNISKINGDDDDDDDEESFLSRDFYRYKCKKRIRVGGLDEYLTKAPHKLYRTEGLDEFRG